VPLTPLAARYDHVLLDLDGCVWVGDDTTPGAAEAVDALRAAGKGVAFVTNDARYGTEDFVRKLWRLGLRASAQEVVTVGGALQHVLHEQHSGATAFVIGEPAFHRHVADAGLRIVNGTDFATRADVVAVAGDESLVHAQLVVAVQALLRGAAFWAAGRDRTYPREDGLWPGTGATVAFLEYASDRVASTVGKPQPQLFETALDRLGPGRALVIGDRLDVDVAGAAAAGLDGAVVLTGATTRDEAERALARKDRFAEGPLASEAHLEDGPVPVAVGATLAELVLA
jgi:HAD superfamily hydrolase (TIGR01450 family)